LFPGEEFLQRKMEDHWKFSVAMAIFVRFTFQLV